MTRNARESRVIRIVLIGLVSAAPEGLTMQWTMDQPGATAGAWKITKGLNTLVASGDTPPPAKGQPIRFVLASNSFLLAVPPASAVTFYISITPHNAAGQSLGTTSAPVVVVQGPQTQQTPTVFGSSAIFPTVELLNYDEKIGVVSMTQLHFAGGDLTVRVKNSGTETTSPIWLVVKDQSQLMRQKDALQIPGLKGGVSQTFSIHLDAILPPVKSQTPEDAQYNQWNQWHRERCGVDLYSVMDWRGPQAQTPIGAHLETALAPNTPICNNGQCVSACQVAKNIHAELDGNVVGYSYFVGSYPRFDDTGSGANGYARTAADGPPIDFTPGTKITVASVSKVVTAIAALRILYANGVGVNTGIGPYLPSGWVVSDFVRKITFSQLLSQTSGIVDYGNATNDYATVKAFYTQPFIAGGVYGCDPRDSNGNLMSLPPGLGFNTDKKYCYSNFNFAIMRMLLPRVAKLPEDPNETTRPLTLAGQYTKLAQQNVFDLVGQKDVACGPPIGSIDYAFSYLIAGGGKGHDWGDNSLVCGAAGWYLTPGDIAKVLLSVSARDGRIFTETSSKHMFDEFRAGGFGLDVNSDKELEKNGAWGADGTLISTSVAIFGPASGSRMVGVLFLNSPILGGPSLGSGAKGVLEKAYNSALKPE